MRKAYNKPGLTRIDLVPSEAVLSSCRDWTKWVGGPDGTGEPCYWEGGNYSCQEAGS
jgi:hypothetical protein